MADLTGKDVGRYHVIERLGQGGMAEVYKAFDTRLEREVALKVIRKDAIAANLHEAMMKRFEREALALARLSHPNIVQVYDFGSYKGEPYLVMEYLIGGTLSLKLAGKPMPWQEAARLLAPVARALECAHEENILHRDVKPANILLTRQGQPKLSDFGIARILDIEGSTQLTGTNMGIGTPEYMSPEQWLGKPVAQTDIYALGVVFYELVTGRRPYTADTPAAVMSKQLTDPLPRPSQYNPDLPEVVEQVLFKALAKNPQDRYTSMAEFAAVLERLAMGQVEADTFQARSAVPAVEQTLAVAPEKDRYQPSASETTQPQPLAGIPPRTDPVQVTQTAAAGAQPSAVKKRLPGWVVGLLLVGLVGAAITEVVLSVRNKPSEEPTITSTATELSQVIITSTVRPTVTGTVGATQAPQLPDMVIKKFSSEIITAPDAVISPLVFSTQINENDYQAMNPMGEFFNPINRVYTTFSFDKMVDGSQWSALWYRVDDGKLICYETKPWDGGKGGYGFTDCEAVEGWQPGH